MTPVELPSLTFTEYLGSLANSSLNAVALLTARTAAKQTRC